MIVKFKLKESLYKNIEDEKKRLSSTSVFYLNTEKRCIKSTTGKDLYLLLNRDKTNKKEQAFIYASLDTIKEKLNEAPFIKGVDKPKEQIEKIYNKAYVEATYYGSLEKSENKQEYPSIYCDSENLGA